MVCTEIVCGIGYGWQPCFHTPGVQFTIIVLFACATTLLTDVMISDDWLTTVSYFELTLFIMLTVSDDPSIAVITL
jgi:hypothetical protein